MFVGREEESALLQQRNWREKSVLAVVYGRRRIGKTALIEHAFADRILWKFEGTENGSSRIQIRAFLTQLGRLCGDPSVAGKWRTVKTWEDALLMLSEKMSGIPCVVFFDEFQWMANMRHSLVAAFKWAWDNHLSKHRESTFVLCGSVSSFMVRNVLRSTALYGRIDIEINLKQLAPSHIAKMLGERRSKEEVLETFMILGGVPQYILELDPQLSLVQNLSRLAFSPNGYFVKEFDRLFISHFGSDHRYERMVNILAEKRVLTMQDLAKETAIPKGGTFSRLVEDLQLAGFADRRRPMGIGPTVRESLVRLSDEYLNFYFSFIKNGTAAENGTVVDAASVLTGHKFAQWQGYAFERLCVKNSTAIAAALGFGGIGYQCGPWQAFGTDGRVNIDLVFERADKVATLCELKHVNSLDGQLIITEFTRQVDTFRLLRSRLSIQKTLILGKKTGIPDEVRRYFDMILYAEDIFFGK